MEHVTKSKTLTADDREALRVRIKAARAGNSCLAITAEEMQRFLDAYEALRHANNRLLDMTHPRKDIE